MRPEEAGPPEAEKEMAAVPPPRPDTAPPSKSVEWGCEAAS